MTQSAKLGLVMEAQRFLHGTERAAVDGAGAVGEQGARVFAGSVAFVAREAIDRYSMVEDQSPATFLAHLRTPSAIEIQASQLPRSGCTSGSALPSGYFDGK